VWASAFAVHALAARARSPFLALLPPAALLAFAGIVMKDGARPVYVLPFLTACLAVLFGDALYRVTQWGPLSVWHGRGALSLGSATWTQGARRVALASLAIAAFTPWLLPGFGARSLLDVRSGVGGAVTIDPIVDIRARLLEQPLFTVETGARSYWRFAALESFNGRKWTSPDLYLTGGQEVVGGELSAPVEVAQDTRPFRELRQVFRFQNLVQPWLPAAFLPVGIEVEEEAVRHDPSTGSLVLPGGTYRGFSYTVTSREYAPTPEELDAIPTLAGIADPRLTELPPDLPSRIEEIARDWTAEAPNPYRAIVAIQDRLRAEYRYDARAPAGHGVDDTLFFLTDSRRGYCEQFAGSMAVLLRTLGIPARVAVGFTAGEYDADSRSFRVTGENAHAWVEVLFPTYGWLAFEPTPGRSNPVASGYTSPVDEGPPGRAGAPDIAAGNLTGKDAQIRSTEARERISGEGCPPGFSEQLCREFLQRRGIDVPASDESSSWRRQVLVGGLVLAILVVLSIPLVKRAQRRLRMARAHSPRERVLAAYEVLVDQARDVGFGREPGETLREYRARLERRVQFSDGHLGRLTAAADRAAYSRLEMTEDVAMQASTDARQAAEDIRRSIGTLQLMAGWFRLERFSSNR
jgi:transglutaminase-like putative cysteine protease